MFKNIINIEASNTWVTLSLADILQVKADSTIRQSIKSSGFHVAHGIHGVIHRELLAGFTGNSPSSITASLVAAVSRLRDSAKLASLTLFHLRDMVNRNMVADISRWDEPTESILKTYTHMIPCADVSLAVRLMIEKPVVSDRWHLTSSSPAFNSIKSYFHNYVSVNKPKLDPLTTPSSVTIEDTAFVYQYLILLNLALNPMQITNMIGYSPALATSGSIMNHSIQLDEFSTFLHACVNIPAHFSLELLRQSRHAFAELFGTIPDSYELRYIEEIINVCAPHDIFKVKTVVSDLLHAPLFASNNSKLLPLYTELLTDEALKWILAERKRLDDLSKDLYTVTDTTFTTDGLLAIPRDMRLISYIKDYNSFDRPLSIAALIRQTDLFKASLDTMVRRLTYQSHIFNLTAAKRLESVCNPVDLMKLNSVLLSDDPGIWSETVVNTADTVVYGALIPTSKSLKFIANKMSFVYGKSSVIQKVIADTGSSVIYDETVRKEFYNFFETWSVSSVPYPSHFIKGEGNLKLPKDDDLCSLFADLFNVSNNTFLELLETSPRAIATIVSSFAVILKDGVVIAGYGAPYGLTYEQIATSSNIIVQIDPARKITAKLIDFHITTSYSLATTNYALGKSLNYFSGSVSKSIPSVTPALLRLTNNVPLINFAIVPYTDMTLKPDYLITGRKILINDNLSSRLSDGSPSHMKSDNKLFSVVEWKATYGSDSWDLKRTTMPNILSEVQPDSVGNAEYEKLVDVIIDNVDVASRSQIPVKPEQVEGLPSASDMIKA